MKIAAVSDDGKTISQHFGRAPYYLVFTIQEREIVGQERREKAGHQQFVQEPHDHDSDELGHGFGAHSDAKHNQMIEPISDCEVVLARGMGHGAHLAMEKANIQPILTELEDAEEAVRAYIDGTLVDHPEWLH